MKVKDLIFASPVLSKAKLTRMDDLDKFNVIKAVRAIRIVTHEYDELVKDAQEKFKGENHDEMVLKAEVWNVKHSSGAPIPPEERADFDELNGYFSEYNRLMNKFRSDEAEKEVSCDYPRLTEDAFGSLVSSNDFTVEEILSIQTVLM